MKKLTLAISLCLLTIFATAGHHLNGTWKMDIALSGQQGGTATIELTEGDGGALTGTYAGALGTQPVKGTVKGAEVEFSFDSQSGKVSYKGTVSGKNIKGTCKYGMLGDGTFKGVKS